MGTPMKPLLTIRAEDMEIQEAAKEAGGDTAGWSTSQRGSGMEMCVTILSAPVLWSSTSESLEKERNGSAQAVLCRSVVLGVLAKYSRGHLK